MSHSQCHTLKTSVSFYSIVTLPAQLPALPAGSLAALAAPLDRSLTVDVVHHCLHLYTYHLTTQCTFSAFNCLDFVKKVQIKMVKVGDKVR
jgi:hypothetical protein